MKKIIGMFAICMIMMVVAIAKAAAYEPNMENATVKGKKITITYEYKGLFYPKTSSFTYNTKTGKVVFEKSGTINRMWYEVEQQRTIYRSCSYAATYLPEHNNALVDLKNKLEKENADTKAVDDLIESQKRVAGTDFVDDGSSAAYNRTKAQEAKDKIINSYPFFTEENFLTLTKEEWQVALQKFFADYNN